jgi:hypothetical protein
MVPVGAMCVFMVKLSATGDDTKVVVRYDKKWGRLPATVKAWIAGSDVCPSNELNVAA